MWGGKSMNIPRTLFFAAVTGLMFWCAVKGVRTGTISYKSMTCRRASNPAMFWFVIGFHGFMGLIFSFGTVMSSFDP